MLAVSAGRHFSRMVVSTGSKISRSVSEEAKYMYDGHSRQEARTGGLVMPPCGVYKPAGVSNSKIKHTHSYA